MSESPPLPIASEDDPPPLVMGNIVPHLLDQSRRFRAMFFRNFQQLELEALQADGRGRMLKWMDENYGEAVKLAPKMMMREPEAAPHASVEDLLEQLDQRATAAKIIDGSPTPPKSPDGSSSSD